MGVDEIICAKTPEPFLGVGMWYEDFSQTTDEEVRDLLDKARHETGQTNQRELAHA
jgi:putative phosphoribosyl transferase